MNNLHDYKGAGWSDSWPTMEEVKVKKARYAPPPDTFPDNLGTKPRWSRC